MTFSTAAMPAPQPPTAPALPADATSGGLAFHRLVFARRRNGWWTPIVTGLVGFAIYVVLLIALIVVVVVASLSDPTLLDRMLALSTDPTFDMTDPFLVAIMLVSIAIMLPSYTVASLIVNGRRVGLVSSAAGRLRWRWMLLCGAIALAWSTVLTLVSALIPTDAAATPAPAENPVWAISLVVLLVLVPVQAAAEEYVFRGYLMQTIGRWLRHPAWAILLPVPLFVFGHLYDAIGLIAVGLFAVAAGWLTWRTGGLEAAIALHVLNNLSAFLLQLAGGADAADQSVGIVSLLWSAVLIGGYVAAIEWLLRRRAASGRPLPRTLVLTPPAPVPVWTPPVWPAPPAAQPGAVLPPR